MKFNCDIINEFLEARARDRYQRECDHRTNLTKWRKVFAWYPIKIRRGDCRWLEYVETRKSFKGYNQIQTKREYIQGELEHYLARYYVYDQYRPITNEDIK